MKAQGLLFQVQDKGYRDFQSKLIPTIPVETIIGVRIPAIRKLAKEYGKDPESVEFLKQLPHTYYDENIFDYYITSASQGDVQLGFFNNDGTKFYPISDDYSGCRIFATSDYRYIYDSSDIIVATYSSGGSLVGTSDNGEILHPMLYGNNRTFFIETESAYILKDSDDDQVENFTKKTPVHWKVLQIMVLL